MREFLKMSVEEWKEKYDFLGFVDYCPDCGKEASSKDKWEDGTSTTCMCDDCKLMWDYRNGFVFMGK